MVRSSPLALLFLLGAVACNGDETASGQLGGGSNTPSQRARLLEYIRAAPYARLVLEVDSVAGFEPRAVVETRVAQRFAQILDKPNGVELVRDETLPVNGDDFVWSDSELDQLASSTFNGDPDQDTIAIHISYVDGHSARDDGSAVVLGLAWGHLQVVIFKQTIEDSCGGQALIGDLGEQACEEAELGILTHELGHVLGLVDNGLTMLENHQDSDAEHRGHDVDQNCIMYWAYEGQQLFDLVGSRLLANDEALSFCQHCLADIDAVK